MSDHTTEPRFIAAEALPVTASSEESEVEALLADIDERVSGLRRLVASRADESARAALLEELGRLAADAQQFILHLAEPDLAARDAEHDAQFADWLARGEQR